MSWALLGLDGELPGAIAVAGTSYFAAGGDSAFRLEVERGFEPGNNWYLTPELRADFYGQDMPESGRGSGLSTLELAARLGYEWTDGLATYVGVIWGKSYGTTEDYLEAEGEDATTTQFLMGVSLSF